MGQIVILPNKEDIYRILSNNVIEPELQSCLRPTILSQAGKTLDENAIAIVFVFAINSYMADRDEVMRDFVTKKTCQIIDAIIVNKAAAKEIKAIFVRLSETSAPFVSI